MIIIMKNSTLTMALPVGRGRREGGGERGVCVSLVGRGKCARESTITRICMDMCIYVDILIYTYICVHLFYIHMYVSAHVNIYV